MATDYDSSLPIRSEADGLDERVLVKIQDATDPSGVDKSMEVSEKLAHVRAFGNDSTGTKVELQLNEEGFSNSQGDYDAVTNIKPSSNALVGHDRNAAPDETHQNKRVTAIAGENDTVNLDVALHDADGNEYTEANPVPVYTVESPSAELYDFNEHADIAKDATDDYDYTVTALKTAVLDAIKCSASGKARWELQVETAIASGIYTTKGVYFSSTAKQSDTFPLYKRIVVGAGIKIRVSVRNDDNSTQSIYTALIGIEK